MASFPKLCGLVAANGAPVVPNPVYITTVYGEHDSAVNLPSNKTCHWSLMRPNAGESCCMMYRRWSFE